MDKKQAVNRMFVTCWEFYKKYHDMDIRPWTEECVSQMADEAMEAAERFGNSRFIRRILYATCDEVCREKEQDDGRTH